MITPSLRIKVTDFLGTDFEQDVFQELMRLKELPNLNGVNFPLYFWYDRENERVDLKTIEPFIKYWKSSGEYLTKLILYPQFFDTQNDFIWYDIRPQETEKYLTDSPLSYIQYCRFSYQYTDPSTGIIEGLKDFHEKFLFVSRDNTTTTKRKQKRNDYEDSSSR